MLFQQYGYNVKQTRRVLRTIVSAHNDKKLLVMIMIIDYFYSAT